MPEASRPTSAPRSRAHVLAGLALAGLAGVALGGASAGCGDERKGSLPSPVVPQPAGSSGGAEAPVDAAAPETGGAGDAGAQTMAMGPLYLVMPDRFVNGDRKNDNAGAPDCFDPSSSQKFHGGDFAGLRGAIGYWKELGVGVVWSTPWYKQAPLYRNACGYHGYWADFADPDDGAVEPKLGTFDEAKALVTALHDAKIGILLDLVVNHPARNARIFSQHTDWFHDPTTCASQGSTDLFCPLSGLPDFAQENEAVARYLVAKSEGWLERLRPDGVRMDTAKHVPLPFFADTWIPAMRKVLPDLFLLAEVYDEGAATVYAPYLAAGFDSAFDFGLRRALVDALARGGSLDAVATREAATTATLSREELRKRVLFLDNHDMPRFLAEAKGIQPAEQEARYVLALSLLFTLPGIPQIYAGDEIGMIGMPPDHRRDMPAWAFSAKGREAAQNLPGYVPRPAHVFSVLQRLAALRAELPAFGAGGYTELARPSTAGGTNTFAFVRSAGGSPVVVVVHDGPAAADRTLSLANAALGAEDRAALTEGAVLEDLLDEGAPARLTVVGKSLTVPLPGRFAGIYRVRTGS